MNRTLNTRFEASIMSSDQLKGLKGDNGEKYVVFIRDIINPLGSAWAWFDTLAAAQEYRNNY